MDGADLIGVDFVASGVVVGGDHKGESLFEIHAELDEVLHADAGVATDGGDALGISDSKPGDAVEHFERSAVEIDREEMSISKRPGELRVDIEIEVWLLSGRDFIYGVAIETHEPVGLIKTMLAHERRSFERESCRGIRNRAESGVVDTAELEISVKVSRTL